VAFHWEECGFSYAGPPAADVPDALRAFGRRYTIPLTRGLRNENLDAILRAHPDAGTWSALEYACHVRDILAVQRERLAQALVEDCPSFAPMRREERVTELQYNEQEPVAVAEDITANADAIAEAFAALDEAGWAREAIYNFPEPKARTMLWLARHTIHEGEHHLLDVGRVLRASRGRAT
jgi:S-DNA-T family DNA segregation ATPase FtsK/SpoIIIE